MDEFDKVITTVPLDFKDVPRPNISEKPSSTCQELKKLCEGISQFRNGVNLLTDGVALTGLLFPPAAVAATASMPFLLTTKLFTLVADYTCKFLTSPNDADFMNTLAADVVTEGLFSGAGGVLLRIKGAASRLAKEQSTPVASFLAKKLGFTEKSLMEFGTSILGIGPSIISFLNLAPSPTEPPKRGWLQQGRDSLKQKFPALSPLLDCANSSGNTPTPNPETPTPETPIPSTGQFMIAELTDNVIDPGESVKLNVKYRLEGQTAEFLEITGIGKGAASHKFTLPADKTTGGEFSFTLKNDKLTGGIASLKNNLAVFMDAFLVDDQGNDGDSGVFDRIIVNPSAEQIKYDILAPLGDAGIIPTSVTLTSDQGLPFRTFG